MIIEESRSWNLCPVCGLPSRNADLTCSKHIVITYDSTGRVVSWQDVEFLTPQLRYETKAN